MSVHPKIIEATKLDAEEIAGLYRTVWTPYRKEFPKELMDNRIPSPDAVAASMDSNEYFVLRKGNKIVGVVRCQFPHGTCHLDRMVVHPEYRNQGVGRALTQYVIDLAKERGASKVWLDTTPALEEATNLYLSMGFREVGHFQKHYWGQDIKFYELLL